MNEVKIRIPRRWAVAGSAALFLSLFLAGFLGFYSLIVPRLVQVTTLSLLAVTGFSLGAGVLSFFAPCSVAIFPSYMGYYLSETGETNRLQAIHYGLIASLGMVLFYGILGVTVSYVGGLASVRTILKIGIPAMAAVLAGVGLHFLSGKAFSAKPLATAGSRLIRRSDKTARNLFLFGVGYSLSSIACIFPVFLLLVVYPFVSGSVFLGIVAFSAFAVGKSVMMVTGTVLTSESKSHLLTRGTLDFGYVKRGSGFLLLLVAAYLVYYSLALHGVIKPVEVVP